MVDCELRGLEGGRGGKGACSSEWNQSMRVFLSCMSISGRCLMVWDKRGALQTVVCLPESIGHWHLIFKVRILNGVTLLSLSSHRGIERKSLFRASRRIFTNVARLHGC